MTNGETRTVPKKPLSLKKRKILLTFRIFSILSKLKNPGHRRMMPLMATVTRRHHMMFLHSLSTLFRRRPQVKVPRPRPSAQLRLELLEDRVVPSFTTSTYTNATVQITPGFTVTEKVTATVTLFPSFDSSNGQITPIPSGATAPTQGTVLFNLNNMQQSATLNSNGQATATFQVPLLAFLTSQTLEVSYQGFFDTSTGNSWMGSDFLAPLYKNWDNVLFPGTLTFNQLTPQQVYAEQISIFQNPSGLQTTLTPYNTAQGETDTLTTPIGPVAFHYVDPGTIDTITALGMQLPGIFALRLNAFAGIPTSSSSSS
jgi:hypothetical protein